MRLTRSRVQLSKLAGGAVGHRARRKRPWATAGYLATTLGTGAIALAQGLAAVVTFRTFAWFGRGFRSPLRDFCCSGSATSRARS